jgi:hypothetical protein
MYEDEIHQIECRWVQGRDFSPVASSYPGNSDFAKQWFDRLRDMAWPPQPGRASGAPVTSVAYLMLDRMAALVWRQWTIDAIPLDTSSTGSRRPLVTRILVGSQQQLTPERAIALCCVGIHSLPIPPLGQVTAGMKLSPIMATDLSELAANASYALENGARHERDLDRLIGAALRDFSMPLSVQLPREELDEPGKGSQIPLLWGLWCTTALLLPDDDEARSWSFSTYEEPLSDKPTGGLAHLVFRVKQPSQPPPVVRTETTVLLGGPEPAEMDSYDSLGAGLAEAYRTLGGPELTSRLAPLADEPDFIDRLNGACQAVLEFMPRQPVSSAPGTVAMEPAAESVTLDAVEAEAQYAPPGPVTADTAEPETRYAPEPDMADAAEPETTQYAPEPVIMDAAAQDNGVRSHARYAESPESPETEDFGVMAGMAAPEIAQPTGAGRHAAGNAQSAAGIADVIDVLAAGPAEPGFRHALTTLHGQMPQPSAQDRADARSFLAQSGWCVPALATFDPERVEHTLEALFRHAVIPDLSNPACQLEVAGWVREDMAPTAVVRSLVAAAHQAGQDKAQLLDTALQPALHRRWLVEHAVYYEASQPASAGRVQLAEHRERPPWQIFVAGPRTAAIASILAWACIALVVALIAVLAS